VASRSVDTSRSSYSLPDLLVDSILVTAGVKMLRVIRPITVGMDSQSKSEPTAGFRWFVALEWHGTIISAQPEGTCLSKSEDTNIMVVKAAYAGIYG